MRDNERGRRDGSSDPDLAERGGGSTLDLPAAGAYRHVVVATAEGSG